jgi:hypothetical protein
MPKKQPIKHLYDRVRDLYEAGYTYREGAKILGIPQGTFAGTICRLRAKGIAVNRSGRMVDERHTVVTDKPSLPKLKFMEGADVSEQASKQQGAAEETAQRRHIGKSAFLHNSTTIGEPSTEGCSTDMDASTIGKRREEIRD